MASADLSESVADMERLSDLFFDLEALPPKDENHFETRIVRENSFRVVHSAAGHLVVDLQIPPRPSTSLPPLIISMTPIIVNTVIFLPLTLSEVMRASASCNGIVIVSAPTCQCLFNYAHLSHLCYHIRLHHLPISAVPFLLLPNESLLLSPSVLQVQRYLRRSFLQVMSPYSMSPPLHRHQVLPLLPSLFLILPQIRLPHQCLHFSHHHYGPDASSHRSQIQLRYPHPSPTLFQVNSTPSFVHPAVLQQIHHPPMLIVMSPPMRGRLLSSGEPQLLLLHVCLVIESQHHHGLLPSTEVSLPFAHLSPPIWTFYSIRVYKLPMTMRPETFKNPYPTQQSKYRWHV